MSLGRLNLRGLGNGEPLRDIAFRNWFGNSKVVDKQGRPLVVYHGTQQADFTSFDPSEWGRVTGRGGVRGFYFTNSARGANTYAGGRVHVMDRTDFDELRAERRALARDRWGSFERARRPGVYAVFLRIENPLVVDFGGNDWSGFARDAEGNGYHGMDEVAGAAHDYGYDGVIARNTCDEGRFGSGYCWDDTTWVVFEPNQIKSANANSGAFSRKTDNILQGLGGLRWRR